MSTAPRIPARPVVYYAEAMDRSAGPSRTAYKLCRDLADQGLTVYRPATTWSGGQHNPLLVEHLNRQALQRADVVIADFLEDVPTIGVPMEAQWAADHDIPVVALWPETRPRSVSLQAAGVHFSATPADALADAAELAERHHRSRRNTGSDYLLKVALSEHPDIPMSYDAEPEKAYFDDAGYDLVTSQATVIPPHTFADVPSTVIGIQPPTGTWGLIIGRSSTLRKRGLLVNSGVIDYGWRGPLFAGVFNLTNEPVIVNRGERLAQYILVPTVRSELIPVRPDDLGYHPRGINGFGSSGGHGHADQAQVNPALTNGGGSAVRVLPAGAPVTGGARYDTLSEVPF